MMVPEYLLCYNNGPKGENGIYTFDFSATQLVEEKLRSTVLAPFFREHDAIRVDSTGALGLLREVSRIAFDLIMDPTESCADGLTCRIQTTQHTVLTFIITWFFVPDAAFSEGLYIMEARDFQGVKYAAMYIDRSKLPV